MDSPTQVVDQTPKEKPVVITSSNNKKDMFKFSIANPKILGALTVLLLLIGGIGSGVYLTQTPQQTTSQASLTGVDLTFQPSEIQAQSASEFNVDIFASANDNQITSTDLTIKYDPQVLRLKSITPGQFLPKILVEPNIEPDKAFVSLGTDGNSGISGSGIIAGLVFEVKDDTPQNSTQITFDPEVTEIKVLNRGDEGISDTLGNAQVVINTIQKTPVPEQEANPSEPASFEESDFNGDGKTNSVDLSILYSGWGTPQSDVQKKADLNKDQIINGIDYSSFLPKFKL